MRSWMAVMVNPTEQVEWDIQLNSCGFYRGNTDPIPASRPAGRPDYHIIFVERGALTVTIQGQAQTAHKDEIAYFPPNTPQDYCYTPGEDVLYYWLHFSGTKAESFFRQFPFEQGIYSLKRLPEYTSALYEIIRTANATRPGGEFMYHGQLQQLLTRIGRALFYKDKKTKNAARVAQITELIRSDPVAVPTNEALAQNFGISVYQLIRTFKEETGLSPGQYRALALAEKAKQLLLDTQLTVSQVSDMLGFTDALYFSRWFKKHTGASPKAFRWDR